MFRSLRLIVLAAAFALAASIATTAFAAPVAWQRVDVTVHSEQAGGVLLISGELPESASLPAEAELAVPTGSQIQWLGEVLGGEPSADPELKYAKTTSGGLDIYRFTMTKSRNAQIEVPTSAGNMFDGSVYSSSMTWTPSQAVPEVRMMVRIPQGSQLVTSAPGASLQPGDSGFSYYTKTLTNVKAGDRLDLAVAYSVPAAPAALTRTSTSDSGSAATIILVLGAVVVAAFIALGVRGKLTKRGLDETPDSADPEAEAEGPETVDSSGAETSEPSEVSGARVATPADSDGAEAFAAKPALSGSTKRNLVTASIIGVLLIAAVVMGTQATRPKMTGDTISETFAAGEPCLTSTIALKVPEGADPGKTAETLFSSLRAMGVLNVATYNVKTASIDVGFCESKTTEGAVRQALAPTGMVADSKGP